MSAPEHFQRAVRWKDQHGNEGGITVFGEHEVLDQYPPRIILPFYTRGISFSPPSMPTAKARELAATIIAACEIVDAHAPKVVQS